MASRVSTPGKPTTINREDYRQIFHVLESLKLQFYKLHFEGERITDRLLFGCLGDGTLDAMLKEAAPTMPYGDRHDVMTELKKIAAKKQQTTPLKQGPNLPQAHTQVAGGTSTSMSLEGRNGTGEIGQSAARNEHMQTSDQEAATGAGEQVETITAPSDEAAGSSLSAPVFALPAPVSASTESRGGSVTLIPTPKSSTVSRLTSIRPPARLPSQRMKKRKLHFDENSSNLDIKKTLEEYDRRDKIYLGREIKRKCENNEFLTETERRRLVFVVCDSFMNIMKTVKPTPEQLEPLANNIVRDMFPQIMGEDRTILKNSFYSGSYTFEDQEGVSHYKRASGALNTWFKNFRARKGRVMVEDETNGYDSMLDIASEESDLTTEEIQGYKNFLKDNSKGKKIHSDRLFEVLDKTYKHRADFFKSNRDTKFDEILKEWPFYFVIPGAISNDFRKRHPGVSDELSMKWPEIAPHIMSYGASAKKSLASLNIGATAAERKVETAALFMLALLIRPSLRSVGAIEGVKRFILVHSEKEKFPEKLPDGEILPRIAVLGNKYTLDFSEFVVLFKDKRVLCDSLIDAVDTAFKSFTVFHVNFPPDCDGPYQFLENKVFKLKASGILSAAACQLVAFIRVPSVRNEPSIATENTSA